MGDDVPVKARIGDTTKLPLLVHQNMVANFIEKMFCANPCILHNYVFS